MKDVSRREFLVMGGTLAAATLAPNVVLAQSGVRKSSPKKIRMGIVGGGFGACFQWHLDPDCIVEAVSDLREDRRKALMDTYKCGKSYNSLEELIKDRNVDAVAVFTEGPSHVKHAVACMKAGKHVISAVPACMSIEGAEELLAAVKKTGLTYMMAETSYYRMPTISARQFYREGKFGDLFYTEAEYFHPNPPGYISPLWTDGNGKRTWRWALPPMWYPTHATAFLIGVTGERLTSVMCLGFDDKTAPYHDNSYKNPYGSEVAFYKTDKGHMLRHAQIWRGAVRGTERAEWYGSLMSFFMEHPNGMGPVIVRTANQTEKDSAGFERQLSEFEPYNVPEYWKTELPESMQLGNILHGGSEPFLTHEFIDALMHDRKPAVDIYESLAMSVPGVIAQKSAIEGGKQMKIPSFDPAG